MSDLVFFLLADESHLIRSMVLAPISMALCPQVVVFGWESCIFRISYLPFQRGDNLTHGMVTNSSLWPDTVFAAGTHETAIQLCLNDKQLIA